MKVGVNMKMQVSIEGVYEIFDSVKSDFNDYPAPPLNVTFRIKDKNYNKFTIITDKTRKHLILLRLLNLKKVVKIYNFKDNLKKTNKILEVYGIYVFNFDDWLEKTKC